MSLKQIEPRTWSFIAPCLVILACLSQWGQFAAQAKTTPTPIPLILHAEYQEALNFISKRKWEEAAILLHKIHKADSSFIDATIALARALTYLHRREEALNLLFESHLTQQGQVLSSLFLTQSTFEIYQEGLNFIIVKKIKPARERFEKALKQEPDNVEILLRNGQCLVLENDYDSAAEKLRLAKKLNPMDARVSLWLGKALHERGEIREALMELKKAWEKRKNSTLAPIWYAEALLSAHQKPSAIQLLQEDLKARPYHLRSLVSFSQLYLGANSSDKKTLLTLKDQIQQAIAQFDTHSTLLSQEKEWFIEHLENQEIKTQLQLLLKQI